MKDQNTNEIKDESWLQEQAFVLDIIALLTDLKLNVQGKNKFIT